MFHVDIHTERHTHATNITINNKIELIQEKITQWENTKGKKQMGIAQSEWKTKMTYHKLAR